MFGRREELIKTILTTATNAKEGHIPSALSILDILMVLYDKILKPEDKFVLSKGHGCLALYAILAEKGIISQDDLNNFAIKDGILGGHPDMSKVKGVEVSAGSLGHGLPIAVGMAMARKLNKQKGHVFCLIGDGECNEGSIWESLLIASHHDLTNLVCIVDYNRSTDRALKLDSLAEKFKAFGWRVYDFNGHTTWLLEHMLKPTELPLPTVVIARTVKGKGIKVMEDNPAWHHRQPTKEELELMLKEL